MIPLFHLLISITGLLGPGGTRAVIAGSLLKQQKYRVLFSAGRKAKSGPMGPSRERIQAIVAMKQRNPRFGYPRIAQQIDKAFGIGIDKDAMRRLLAAHYRPWSGFPNSVNSYPYQSTTEFGS